MTKVVRFDRTGGPEVLTIKEVDLPTPGVGELKLEVHAIGLNRAESMFRLGQYLEAPELPAGLGYEAAGIVSAVGANVSDFTVGNRVAVIPGFSMNRYSCYGEEAIVPSASAVKIPENTSFEHAAASWMQYMTAFGALVAIAQLRKEDAVLIPAASSSVGLAAIQIVNAMGGVSIAVTRTAEKRQKLLDNGAQHVIVTQEQDIAAEVAKITNGAGARIVFDPVGGPDIEKLAHAAAFEGIVFQYGALSTEATPFPLFAALSKGLTFRGYTLMELKVGSERFENGKKFVLDGLKSGVLKPVIAKTFDLTKIVDAHTYLESNQQVGKIVVTVAR